MQSLCDIVEIASEITGISTSDIDVDVPIYETGFEDDQLLLIFSRAAERHGRNPKDLYPPQLLLPGQPSANCITGLRELALLLPAARRRLDYHADILLVEETFRSWAASIEAGRFVPSTENIGTRSYLANPLLVLFKYSALFAATYFIPAYFLEQSCAPLCDGFFDHSRMDLAWLPAAAMLSTMAYLAYQFVPVAIELRKPRTD